MAFDEEVGVESKESGIDSKYEVFLYADIVFCLDLSSGKRNIIENLETSILSFYRFEGGNAFNVGLHLGKLRIKIIGFRDTSFEYSEALEESTFFSFPEDAYELDRFLVNLKFEKRKNKESYSLDALALALQSDWCNPCEERVLVCHHTILFTDSEAKSFESTVSEQGDKYPAYMPKSYNDLVELWYGKDVYGKKNTLSQYCKFLYLYTVVDKEPWEYIGYDFDNTIGKYFDQDKFIDDVKIDLFENYFLWHKDLIDMC